MQQTGNSIHPGNIQHFVDSAKNAIQLGQRQFFTPPDLAEAFCSVFANSSANTATDLMAGNLALLKASKRSHACGIDVDERINDLSTRAAVYQADITRWYPLAHQARLKHDLLVLNPPFSLQWYLDRLAPLAMSDATGVKETYALACVKGDTIDSTLGTLLIALDSLTTCGEGFMICNADTARRLLGDPLQARGASSTDHGPRTTDHSCVAHPSLMENIWCWLDVPGAVYENQNGTFPTAVLYFSASHGKSVPSDRLPIYLHAPSADPRTVTQTLATALSARAFAMCGRSNVHDFQTTKWNENFLPTWNAIKEEYHQLYHGTKPDFNLSLRQDGTIRSYLDPFRKTAYVHDRDLLQAFRSMDGSSPAALVVQQASRAALKHAMHAGCWRVDPALIVAVDNAIAAYEAVRAPFYTPNEVQSLGWLDEESHIQCKQPGIPGFTSGKSYTLKTYIEDTTWKDKKVNLSGDRENLAMSGRELVVELADDDAIVHKFHVRRDDSDDEEEEPAEDATAAARNRRRRQAFRAARPSDDEGNHHHIQSLIDHFQIPIPRDVAQTNPAAYQANLARLDILQALVNAA